MEIITYIIIGVLSGLICFFIGWKVAIHPDIVSNEQAEKEYAKLQLETEEARKQLNKIENKYNDIQKYTKDAETNAELIYKNKIETLELQHKNKKDKLLEEQKEFINLLKEEQLQEKQELESLRATKAAAIEAARKEELIHKTQEDYCLRISAEEQNDVAILSSIRNKITKPRAVSMVIWSQYYQPIAKRLFPKILGSENVCGIYKITNQKTGECYIGQARDVRKRWNEHSKYGLAIDTPQGNKLYKAMQEYGLEYFSFELIEECSPEKLNEKERYFISLYSADTLGYNSNKGVK